MIPGGKTKYRDSFANLTRSLFVIKLLRKKLRSRNTDASSLNALKKLIKDLSAKMDTGGGTSTIDVLSFYRRRPDVDTEIVEFDEWMTNKPWNKEAVEDQISFQIDFKDWQQTLTKQEKTILSHLTQGYKAKDIAEILQLTYQAVKTIIKKLKQMFLEYFRLEEFAYP